MTYNPDYIPAGVNNTDNEYYKTHNNSHIPREWETRALFLGKASITTTGDPEVTTFDNGGTNYTQILYRQSGVFKTTKEINNASYAIVGGGGSGGNVGQVPGGGGGAEALVFENVTMPVQETFMSIGAGAPGALSGNGNKGGTTSWLGIAAQGGGYGGGAGAGGDGGNGGGGGTNGTANSPGGTGDQFNGGAAFGSSTFAERSSGGGGGAGAVGQTASISSAGDGGAGLTLAWTNGAIQVSGGGGGSTINGVDNGTATHGGTAGTYGAASANATNGGGSGGTGGSAPNSGDGGGGLVVIVFPTSEAVVQ